MRAHRPIPTVALLTSLLALGCNDLVAKLTKEKSADAGTVADASFASAPAASTAPADVASSVPTGTTAARTASPPTKPAPSKPDLDKAFAALDINHDDQLDGIEVKNCGCAIADANGDGEITKAEYLAAGLVGKLRPGAAPAPTTTSAPTSTTTSAPTSTPTQNNPPAPPQASGAPPGLYKCAGSVGGMYMTTGRVVILDATRYATGADGSGQGTYKFFPETGQIVFTSGPNADLDTVSYARLVAPTHIQMKTGKNGRYLWDCKR